MNGIHNEQTCSTTQGCTDAQDACTQSNCALIGEQEKWVSPNYWSVISSENTISSCKSPPFEQFYHGLVLQNHFS